MFCNISDSDGFGLMVTYRLTHFHTPNLEMLSHLKTGLDVLNFLTFSNLVIPAVEMSIAMFFHAGFFAGCRVLQVFAGFLQVFRV